MNPLILAVAAGALLAVLTKETNKKETDNEQSRKNGGRGSTSNHTGKPRSNRVKRDRHGDVIININGDKTNERSDSKHEGTVADAGGSVSDDLSDKQQRHTAKRSERSMTDEPSKRSSEDQDTEGVEAEETQV